MRISPSGRLGFLHRWRVLPLGIALLAAGAAIADTETPIVSESQIKAAFLYNFTRFVEWPDEAFSTKSEPLVIGVLGQDGLTAHLHAIVSGRKVNGREILVRNVETAADIQGTQVLFVGVTQDSRFVELNGSIAHAPVLTVGESAEFAAAGGAIYFVQRGGKLRFEINIASAERARVKVSAELQKLATAVTRTP